MSELDSSATEFSSRTLPLFLATPPFRRTFSFNNIFHLITELINFLQTNDAAKIISTILSLISNAISQPPPSILPTIIIPICLQISSIMFVIIILITSLLTSRLTTFLLPCLSKKTIFGFRSLSKFFLRSPSPITSEPPYSNKYPRSDSRNFSKDLKLLQWDYRGARYNLASLQSISHNFNIICLQESLLKPDNIFRGFIASLD